MCQLHVTVGRIDASALREFDIIELYSRNLEIIKKRKSFSKEVENFSKSSFDIDDFAVKIIKSIRISRLSLPISPDITSKSNVWTHQCGRYLKILPRRSIISVEELISSIKLSSLIDSLSRIYIYICIPPRY